MIKFKQTGDFKNVEAFLKRNGSGLRKNTRIASGLHALAQKGVDALRQATPRRTGKTAESWGYEIVDSNDGLKIVWTNSNYNDWANVAILIQYGHGLPSGAYVEGIDYINPALKPIFDEIADDVWLEVTSDGK